MIGVLVTDCRQRMKSADISLCWLFLPAGSKKVKVKFSDTRYRALGPELIPVYRQSVRR